MHGDVPAFVTLMTPVIVPAAPWPWAGDALTLVQAVEAALVDVVVGAAVVEEVDGDVVDVA